MFVYAMFMGVSMHELLDQVRWKTTFQPIFAKWMAQVPYALSAPC